MKKTTADGTVVYQRAHKRGLTMPQLNAIDLLASGKTDKETAELLNLSRTCVTKWRLYDPVFQAALNRRRAEVWGVGIDRLRSLIPKALDALSEEVELSDSPHRLKAAVAILRLAQWPSGVGEIGPTDAEEIVRRIVEAKRVQARSTLEDFVEQDKGLPHFNRHMQQTWEELETLANASEEATEGKD